MKGTVKIAYWDTQQQGRRPPLLGEIQGTPTIRLYKPKRGQGLGHSKKTVVDYQYERTAKDLKRFVDEQMPNFVESISNGIADLAKVQDKANRNGLPLAIMFTSKPTTTSLLKFLSTEFRRRLLLAEVKPTKPNQKVMEQFGVTNVPAVIVILPNNATEASSSSSGDSWIVYDGDGFTKNKLQRFLSEHALKEPVDTTTKKIKEEAEPMKEKKRKVHTEL